MKYKKIISVFMASAIALSVAGCSFMNNTMKKTKKAIEKIGYEEEKAENFFDDLEDYEEDDWEDGLFGDTTDEDLIKNYIEYYGSDFGLKKKNIDEVLFAQEYAYEDGLTTSTFRISCIEFKDIDSADKFFDNIVDAYEDMDKMFAGYSSDEVAFETDEDDDYFYMAFELKNDFIYNGCYVMAIKDGNIVTFMFVTTDDENSDRFEDLMEDFCNEAGYDNPKDLL